MEHISILPPIEDHAEEIAIICSTGWLQTVEGKLSEAYKRKNIDHWYNLERVKKDIREGTYTHIALIEDKVIGVIGGGMIDKSIGEIFVLYMDEKYRYKGIGKLLLDALTKEQLSKGATEQWVSVQEDNMLGIPFYEARGFIFQGKKVTITETGEKQVSLRYSRLIK